MGPPSAPSSSEAAATASQQPRSGDDEINREPDGPSLAEMLGATSLEDSVSVSTCAGTIIDDDASPPPSPPAGHACSAASSSGPRPAMWLRHQPDWYVSFYVRQDRGGSFRTRPDLGGPFQSLQEVDDAIQRHLDERQCPELMKKRDELPFVERLIQYRLFYPDGTPKRGPNSPDVFSRRRHFAQSLLDQYNDDQNLSGDLVHELEDVVRYQLIYEGPMRYYHFNFTTKMAKAGGDGTGNLFFAEVAEVLRADGLEVSCLCIVEPTDDGHCYGCRNNGNPGMRHPSNVDAYVGGHLDGYFPWGFLDDDSDEDDEALATRIRASYEV